MKTSEALGIIESMIDEREKYEDAVLADDPVDEELLHEIELDMEALCVAKRALEKELKA